MGDLVTVDVIDRPAGGALRALRTVRALTAPQGCRAIVPCVTGDLVASLRPALRPRRVAVLAAWRDEAALDAALARGPLGALGADAREHWHVRGELARSNDATPLRGWTPDPSGNRPLADDDPVLAIISGELRSWRVLVPFVRANLGAVARAEAHPGYLGGCALFSSPLNTTSCSAWRSAADARDYAFRPGRHREALERDRAREWHVTERFLRLRVLASAGTLDGRRPFAGLVPEVRRAAVAA